MKTTPTLGLKLYDGTDAPDLVSGYNASMSALDGAHVMHRRGDLSHLRPDLNSLSETGYYNANGYTFTKENHGPVGSHNIGLLVVYDRCIDLNSRTCATQQYFPRKDGTGDAYRPMARTLADGVWSAWAPLVDVPEVPDNVLTMPSNGSVLKNGGAVYNMTIGPSGGGDGSSSWANTFLRFNANGHTPRFAVGPNGGVLEDIYSINGVPFDNTIYEYKTLTGLTAWLRAFSSTGEWWSGPGEVTITANGSTQQYTGNWTVYRTPSIGNAYFQGSEGRAATAHFASLKTDHNANCWAFVMSIKDTEPTFQYVGSITPQLTAMLKRVTTFDAS